MVLRTLKTKKSKTIYGKCFPNNTGVKRIKSVRSKSLNPEAQSRDDTKSGHTISGFFFAVSVRRNLESSEPNNFERFWTVRTIFSNFSIGEINCGNFIIEEQLIIQKYSWNKKSRQKIRIFSSEFCATRTYGTKIYSCNEVYTLHNVFCSEYYHKKTKKKWNNFTKL